VNGIPIYRSFFFFFFLCVTGSFFVFFFCGGVTVFRYQHIAGCQSLYSYILNDAGFAAAPCVRVRGVVCVVQECD